MARPSDLQLPTGLVRPQWGLYLTGILGYLLYLLLAFFYSGGLVLLCENGHHRDWCVPLIKFCRSTRPFSPPVPRLQENLTWRAVGYVLRLRATSETFKLEPVEIALLVVTSFNACPLLLWALGFFWPAGIVSSGACCRRRRSASPRWSSESTRRSSLCASTPLAVSYEEVSPDALTADVLEAATQGSRYPTGGGGGWSTAMPSGGFVTLYVRTVTLGRYPELILENVLQNISVLENYNDNVGSGMVDRSAGQSECDWPMIDWTIEVVTERATGVVERLAEWRGRIFEVVVPRDYVSARGTLAKGRALHYMNEIGVSPARPSDFILHLDEETLMERSSVEGLVDFMVYTPDRVGQGMIVYGRGPIVNPMITMVDCSRVLDDYCSFRMFFSSGYPMRAMKGSFVIMRSDVEKRVSFDVGPKSSVTEDAAFALDAMAKGVKFAFVPGVMMEQSPFTLYDFLKQRRRWFQGLFNVVSESWIPWHAKWWLTLMMISWSTLPVWTFGYGIFALLFKVPVTPVTVAVHTFLAGTTVWGYTWGALMNFGTTSLGIMYPICVVLAPLVMPLLCAMEAVAVLFALCTRPAHFFEVVKKGRGHESDESGPVNGGVVARPTASLGKERLSQSSIVVCSSTGCLSGRSRAETVASESRSERLTA